MTDLLTTDHADSGEIPSSGNVRHFFHEDVVDTAVIEPTHSLTAYLRTLPPLRALRLADADPAAEHDTAELPLMPTGAELAVAALHPTPPGTPPGPIDPPMPSPPPPLADARPSYHRARHRRPVAAWAWLLTGAGLVLLGEVATLAVLA